MQALPLPATLAATRHELQRVATHVLARRRFDRCGRFGLRATPGGFGTPAYGDDHEVLRVAGTRLVRETTGDTAATAWVELSGSTLSDAAAFGGVDLAEPFAVGGDTVELGDIETPVEIDAASVEVLADWYHFSSIVLDATLATLGSAAAPTVVQLWPEHFDLGCDVAATPTRRVNLGASPGDTLVERPYLYLGPWNDERPGDASYWNAPFGAVATAEEVLAAADPLAAAIQFLLRGVALLRG